MFTGNAASKLKKMLIRHEGYFNKPYVDTVGKISVGIGYNLTDRGLPDEWIMKQYDADVAYFYARLGEDYRWFNNLSEVRQAVLVDMCFMGYKHFQQFYKMLNALSHGDYRQAAEEMLDSMWAQQVGNRARDLAKMMETDQWMD